MNMILKHIAKRAGLLIFAGALMLCSCENEDQVEEYVNVEKMITDRSEMLTTISSENGKQGRVFKAALMEHYGLAQEPYIEFRKGVTIEFYNDTTGVLESYLIADYGIQYEKTKISEAKGNVVAMNVDGDKFETQQLFWNQKTKMIYSNVDVKVTWSDGRSIKSTGFESPETLKGWHFRNASGRMVFDPESEESEGSDQTQPQSVQPQVPSEVKGEDHSNILYPAPPEPKSPLPENYFGKELLGVDKWSKKGK